MKTVYIAKRISRENNDRYVLDINAKMHPEEIHRIYIEKTGIEEKFIYNGPWILRQPIGENDFSPSRIPLNLECGQIWNMVKEKIESSDILLGVINLKAFGTIAEIGFACKCKMAVYVVPDKNVTSDELQDLWFIFQMAKTTEHLWCGDDIKLFREFSDLGINSISEYKTYIDAIIPKFME